MHAAHLDVITCVSNPIRWASRIALARQFIEHMLDSGVRLTVVEAAFGERPFELAGDARFQHVGVRQRTLAWNKESLINVGFSRLPADWEYAAWIDADIVFRRHEWAAETVHALQQYHVVQPWGDCYDLGPHGEHVEHHTSFAKLFASGKPIVQGPKCGPNTSYRFAHPGYAWAATRQALDLLGGLIDTAALGAADHHMALALIGRVMESVPGNLPAAYSAPLLQWQARATQHIGESLGYVAGTIEHQWHGAKVARGYASRWSILSKHNFDPNTDLKRNLHGVVELAGNKPRLAADIDRYMRSRMEDGNVG